MSTVVLFPSVLGVRRGVLDLAAEWRDDGHEVLVPDLYDGRVFDEYTPALAFALEETGQAELMRRALVAAAAAPDGFVVAGFSLGAVMAVHVATCRPVTGVLMIAGAVPVSALGPQARWPAGVPAQTHATLHDPWREQEEVEQARRDVAAGRSTLEVFDYPGSGHLFTDPTLPAEYDAGAAALFGARALAFVRACGTA